MSNKAMTAAAAALAEIVNPKAAEAGGNAVGELMQLIGGIDKKLAELEAQAKKTGLRIKAWNELPTNSAQSIAEASELVDVVGAELDVVRGLHTKLERAKKVGKRVPGSAHHIETLCGGVEAWRRDLESDKEALLVASRAVNGNGRAVGDDVPLPTQVEKALADAYKRRDSREDEAAAARMLPTADDRKKVAERQLAAIDEDNNRQRDLETRVKTALEEMSHAEFAPPPELRAAADQLKAWGMSLAFEKRAVEQLRR